MCLTIRFVFQDYNGPNHGNGWPIEDKKQNYDYVGSSETNDVTVLKFKRKLVTCDKEDRDIPVCLSFFLVQVSFFHVVNFD